MGSGTVDVTDRATAELPATNMATLLPAVAQQWRKAPGTVTKQGRRVGRYENTDVSEWLARRSDKGASGRLVG